jgi:tyrosinase
MSYQVTGRVNTNVNARLSIIDLQTNHQKQFTLFVLAYLVVQDRISDVQKLLSNFAYTSPLPATFQEIAGIHGLPYTLYSGDPNDTDPSHYDGNDKKDTLPSPSRFGGYCNHGSVLFPTWHRVYMLLVEPSETWLWH